MSQPILVINCGSSSVKFALITPGVADSTDRPHGLAEKLGTPDACIHLKYRGEKTTTALPDADHTQALQHVLQQLEALEPEKALADNLAGIGHRVVHGGEAFTDAPLITPAVIDSLKAHIPLAPLHNPANLLGIKATQTLFPDLPQVAVFDTAFHQTMPERAWRYALPHDLYTEHGVRRYGFHGTSHAYVSHRATQLQQAENKDGENTAYGWITTHLGNGCSAAAVWNGQSMDTSMGLTPLEGLVMGTRCGSIDPGLHMHLLRTLNLTVDALDQMLNKQSGLLGMSGLSNDMRTLEAAAADGNAQAAVAIEVFCYRAAKEIAALSCALPAFTGIVFTGGIGENAAGIRSGICQHLAALGVRLDDTRNAQAVGGATMNISTPISTPASAPTSTPDTTTRTTPSTTHSTPSVWVIPTDEEWQIAAETLHTIQQSTE